MRIHDTRMSRPTRLGLPAYPEGGFVQVSAENQQDDEAVRVDRWVQLAADVLAAEGVKNDAELSLLFVDEPTIADLNQRFMDGAGPTDVLAFPIDAATHTARPGSSSTVLEQSPEVDPVPRLLGDVVICPAVAARQAAPHPGGYEAEMALLVVHGVLHILGHDHAEPDEAARMEARQHRLLDELYRQRP